MPFKPGDTAVSSSAAGFAIGSGVCQDHAHVFIACCRYLGVPARYVSGYVYSPGPRKRTCEPRLGGSVGRRPLAQLRHRRTTGPRERTDVRLAVGADYFDACPIRGVRTGGGAETMSARRSSASSSNSIC